MSATEALDPVTTQEDLTLNYYFQLISFTLLFYDYFLTLDWEVARYWGTSWSWPTFFYFVNRYATLLGNIPVVLEYFWSAPPTPRKLIVHVSIFVVGIGCRGACMLRGGNADCRCAHIESYHQYYLIATQVLVGAMLILRTYALYERNKRVLALMLVFTTGSVAVGIWSVFRSKSSSGNTNLSLYVGCDYPTTKQDGLNLLIPWAAVAVFDTMIFVLTLGRVLYRRSKGLHGARASGLLTLLLRDGAIYFAVMVMSNLANIFTFAFGGPFTRGIATTFTNVLASIMISRLMLNLRDPALAHMSGRRVQMTSTTLMESSGRTRTEERQSPDVVLDTEYELTTRDPNYSPNADDFDSGYDYPHAHRPSNSSYHDSSGHTPRSQSLSWADAGGYGRTQAYAI
ncbi:hypothetical protein HMN09_00931700 [Mycena chlorophos]|uniref:DUF6533 domain-containing protein n=1 Tax=Mycena chlorophos TaxID=658473 RepID=A0A8H6SMD3_MYCCL|nr:hypothetical protein HMN09_00931700 [Mycena chlorophos]